MIENRLAAGLWCTDVLRLLSAYLDAELAESQHAQVSGHLASCDNCTKFGAQMSGLLSAVNEQKWEISPAVAGRLHRALKENGT